MVFQEGGTILATGQPAPAGKAKGAEQVLWERSLFESGMSLNGGKAKDPEKSMVFRLEKCLDFQGAKSLLEEMTEAQGHMCVFGTKFHCECAAIELPWGLGKQNLRSRCDFSLDGLRQNSLWTFLDVPLLTVRKFFQKARDYMRAYCEGHMTLTAEKKVLQYKSHRRPAPSEFLHC